MVGTVVLKILLQLSRSRSMSYKESDKIYVFSLNNGAAITRIFTSKVKYTVKFVGVLDTVAATKGSLNIYPDTYPASVFF